MAGRTSAHGYSALAFSANFLAFVKLPSARAALAMSRHFIASSRLASLILGHAQNPSAARLCTLERVEARSLLKTERAVRALHAHAPRPKDRERGRCTFTMHDQAAREFQSALTRTAARAHRLARRVSSGRAEASRRLSLCKQLLPDLVHHFKRT